MMINKNIIIPFKGRKIEYNKPVLIYRNLNKKDFKWYSIKQNGKVVGHAKRLCLKGCVFKVSEKINKRVKETNKREVHAYIFGYVTSSGFGLTAESSDLPCKISYNPFIDKGFVSDSKFNNKIVEKADFCTVNSKGIHAAYVVFK